MKPVDLRRTGLGAAAFLAFSLIAASASQAAAPNSFDGVYTGDVPYGTPKTQRVTCPTAYPNVRLRVTNGIASINWNGPFTGPVGADGSVALSGSNGGSIVGNFSATGFSGTITGAYCIFKADFKKN